MLRALTGLALAFCTNLASAHDFGAVGMARVFTARSGERITVVEIDQAHSAIAQFRNIDGSYNGKTLRFKMEESGSGKKEIFIEKGRKKSRFVVMAIRGEQLDFTDPSRPGRTASLQLSAKETKVLEADKFLNDNPLSTKP